MIEEVFTAIRASKRITVSSILPCFYSLQVKGTGAAAGSWTVTLQGSNDGTNWTDIISHTTTDGSTAFSADAIPRPYRHLRINCSALSLSGATNVVAYAVGTPA